MKIKLIIPLMTCLVGGILAKPPPTFVEYKDSLGQYSFGYSAPGSARSEVRSVDGSTRGSYSYVDVLGNIQSAQYTADGENGFQIVATNLPQAPSPVEDTPEVAAARVDHLRALEAAAKLAEEKPEEESNEQTRSIVDPEKVESAENSQNIDSADVRAQEKEKSSQSAARNASPIPQQSPSNENANAAAKSSPLENQDAKQISEQSSQDASSQQANQPQAKSSEISPKSSDIPVVSTSFVIPGSVNLRTKIELDQSSRAAAAVPPSIPSQPSIAEGGSSSDSSTPAATRLMSIEEAKSSEAAIQGASSSGAAPEKSLGGAEQPLTYSRSPIPAILAPTPVYTFTYGIGIDPIYQRYNPYQYFPYGIL